MKLEVQNQMGIWHAAWIPPFSTVEEMAEEYRNAGYQVRIIEKEKTMTAKKANTKKAAAKKSTAKKAPAKKKTAAKKKAAATPTQSKDGRKFLTPEQKVKLVEFFTKAKAKDTKFKDAHEALVKALPEFAVFTESNLTAYYYAAGGRLVVKAGELVDTSK